MASPTRSDSLHIGFLAIVDAPGGGHVGGLLVTNKLGRPLEFQCTTPVRPNRTQEILYGPTLLPFLFSELIGKTLVERLQVSMQLILVDQPDVLGLRQFVEIPIGCIVRENSPAEHPLADQTRLTIGRSELRFALEAADDLETVREFTRHFSADVDLAEPLDRVREALQETLKGAA